MIIGPAIAEAEFQHPDRPRAEDVAVNHPLGRRLRETREPEPA
jgi:hypothetical protein